ERGAGGVDLQRAGDPRADPARPAWRAFQAGQRHRAAAPEHAGVRGWRRAAALRRHQADRPRAGRDGRHLRSTAMNASISAQPLQERAGLRAPLLFAVVTLVVFGLLYSLVGTALGRALFPAQAAGSLVERGGRVVGSVLVAQPFADARYFQPRPSAANYDPMAAAGSN